MHRQTRTAAGVHAVEVAVLLLLLAEQLQLQRHRKLVHLVFLVLFQNLNNQRAGMKSNMKPTNQYQMLSVQMMHLDHGFNA